MSHPHWAVGPLLASCSLPLRATSSVSSGTRLADSTARRQLQSSPWASSRGFLVASPSQPPQRFCTSSKAGEAHTAPCQEAENISWAFSCHESALCSRSPSLELSGCCNSICASHSSDYAFKDILIFIISGIHCQNSC